MPYERLSNWKTFRRRHRGHANKLKNYSITKRGREVFKDDVLEDLMNRSAASLSAMNATARIEFCRAARRAFKARFPDGKEMYFVTLAPAQFVTTLEDAYTYDWSELQAWAEEVLKGFTYFGIVDAAPYSNTPNDRSGKVVSWHIHVIVWDADREMVEALVSNVNRKYEAFLPLREAANLRPVRRARTLRKKVTYMLKAPLRTYRVYPEKKDGRLTGTWRQKKDWHKPGQGVAACRFMHGADIDKLCIAGRGAGIRMLRSVAMRAKRAIDGLKSNS